MNWKHCFVHYSAITAFLFLLKAFTINALNPPPSQSAIPIEIETRNGRIRGIESIFLHKRVRSFLSVPFAESPIGDLRFRPPVAKTSWNGTIETTILSPACSQGRDNYNTSFWGSEMWNANTPTSEDCLYVNIWTPGEAKNLTVMVWIFGGGFYYGSPSLVLYDGKALAVTGNVVVVNINYRVGAFGYLYLDHEEVPGNMGMLDQKLALQWIQANIGAFGGNPESVTLFGESAGASSIVAHLIASPGLFRNGILQSGSLDNTWSMDVPARALEKSLQFTQLVGCNRSSTDEAIKCLKTTSAANLVDQLWNIRLESFIEFPLVTVSKDRNFFKDIDAYDALRQRKFSQDVNLMIGINHDEGNFWNIYNMPKFFDVPEQPLLTLDNFNECVSTAFAQLPEAIKSAAAYVYLGSDRCNYATGRHKFLAEQVNQMVGDYFFTCDSLWLADQLDNAPANVFIYYFDQPSSANPWPAWTGVMHGYEIEYVFGVPLHNTTAGYTNRERVLSHKMIQYWSSFAATGAPSLLRQKDSDEWPAYSSRNRLWMHLKGGSHTHPIPASKKEECRVWRTAKDLEYADYVFTKLALSSATSARQQQFLILVLSVCLAHMALFYRNQIFR